jgi:hypothetical protein
MHNLEILKTSISAIKITNIVDGDEAIMNASLVCFQDAQTLLCSSHRKDNIQRKLKK